MLHVISGCSSGGKTTLVNALASRGFRIVDEPGRAIVRQELDSGGEVLPWAEHFENDSERKHTFEEPVAEYDRLLTSYSAAGYVIQTLPKASVPDRIDFVLEQIR